MYEIGCKKEKKKTGHLREKRSLQEVRKMTKEEEQ